MLFFTVLYTVWRPIGRKVSSGYQVGCIIASASVQQPVERFKSYLQNITTDWMLHSVFIWYGASVWKGICMALSLDVTQIRYKVHNDLPECKLTPYCIVMVNLSLKFIVLGVCCLTIALVFPPRTEHKFESATFAGARSRRQRTNESMPKLQQGYPGK